MAVVEREETDFRSDRMPSVEGQGKARSRWQRAWDSYVKVATPAVKPLAERLAGDLTADLCGFWLMWQLEGGFEGLQRLGMSRASIYRRIKLFRKIFGQHPDEFEFPGVRIDVAQYLSGGGKLIGERDTHPSVKSQITDK